MFYFFLLNLVLSFGLRTINPNESPFDGNQGNSLIVKEHSDLGNCPCDITDQCEKYCSCDPDCPVGLFNDTIIKYPNMPQSERKALRMCDEPKINESGSLLDWIQRTMLCVYRDNNPSTGKFFELNEKSITTDFTENESSLRYSFQSPKEIFLKPLISTISLKKVFINNGDNLYKILNDLNCTIENDILYQENIILNYQCNGTVDVDTINISMKNCYISNDEINCEGQAENGFSDAQSKSPKIITINYKWPRNESATVSPRGYYMSDKIVTENGYATIDTSVNNYCSNANKVDLLFGMDLDVTCFLQYPITNCSLIYSNITKNDYNCAFIKKQDNIPYLDASLLEPDFKQISKVPFPNDDQDNYISSSEASQKIVDSFDKNVVSSLFLTGLTRSIDIFYKTVGYENNPTHIIMSMNTNYDYSSSVIYFNTDFFPQYQNIALRTVVRFYEYPNNLNMFKGSSNHTLYSWLPFKV